MTYFVPTLISLLNSVFEFCHISSCMRVHNSFPLIVSLSTHADRQGVDISVTVCVFVCTVTDFSADDKASGVKFCKAVHWRLTQGISHFGELFSPQKLKIGRIGQRIARAMAAMRAGQPCRGRAHGPRVRSACVDIRRPSPKTAVLIKSCLSVCARMYTVMHVYS